MPTSGLPVIVGGGSSYTWTTSSGATAKTFTFPIPPGTYASATWTLAYTYATYSGSGTYQLQITVPGSALTIKDSGRSVTASGSYSDTITVLVNDHIGIINNYAGQILSVTLLPVNISGSASWTGLTITTFSLNLTAHTHQFAKRWSADGLNGAVVLSWVDNDANAYVATHGGLSGQLGTLTTGWATAVNLAPYAEDINLGVMTNSRCYLTYTKSDNTKTVKSTQYRTNDVVGAGDISSWSSETSVPTAVDPTDFHPTGGPFQPLGGIQYVVSQNNNQGGTYFIRNGDRLTSMNTRLVSVETDLVHGVFSSQIGPWTCVDGQGASWTWMNNSATTGGAYTGNYNSYDNLQNRYNPLGFGGTNLPAVSMGRGYNRVVGAPLVSSPIVASRHGVLGQLVYINRYARIAPWNPATFIASNNDGALGFKVTTPFTVAVPTDSNPIGDVEFYVGWQYQERTYTDCVLPEGNFPATVTIPVPAMTGILDPATNYGLAMWFDLDFTFWPNANNFTIRFGSDDGDPTSIWSRTYPVNGRGEYVNSTRFFLTDSDMENIWSARGTNITLPITYQGDPPDNLVFKKCQWEYDFYGSFLFQGCSGTVNSAAHTSLVTTEADMSTSTVSAVDNYVEWKAFSVASALVADVQAASVGSGGTGTWAGNFILDKGSSGGQPSTPYPYLFTALDAYCLFSYYLSAPDWFFVRSYDFGKTWEFANNCQPITQLADLKAFNALSTGSYTTPVLVAMNDTFVATWVEAPSGTVGTPHAILTQDCGDSWTV